MAFARVLVVADRQSPEVTREAVGRALALAGAVPPQVVAAVHAVAPVHEAGLEAPAGDHLREALLADAGDRLRDALAGIDCGGVDLTSEAAWMTDPVSWIAAVARDGGFGLLVVPLAEGEAAPVASRVDALLRAARLPVLVVRAGECGEGGAVVGAVDVADGDPLQQRLDRRVAAFTALLAQRRGGAASLLHVAPVSTVLARAGLVDLAVARARAEAAYGALLDALAADAGLAACGGWRVLAGEPATAIVQAGRDAGVGLLVLGTRLREGLHGRLFGGTALAVLAHWPGDLLVVPPER